MTVVVFSALLWQIVDFISELANWGAYRASVIKQAVAWVAGILLVWIASSAAVTAALVLPGTDRALGSLDGGSIVLVGLLVSSLASTGRDLTNAIDNKNTAYVPPLGGPAAPPSGG